MTNVISPPRFAKDNSWRNSMVRVAGHRRDVFAVMLVLAAISTVLIFVLVPPRFDKTAVAQPKTYKIIMANVLNPGDPTVDAMTDFKKDVEGKSGGRISVELYPSAQLGSQEEVVEMLKSGAAQIHI